MYVCKKDNEAAIIKVPLYICMCVCVCVCVSKFECACTCCVFLSYVHALYKCLIHSCVV